MKLELDLQDGLNTVPSESGVYLCLWQRLDDKTLLAVATERFDAQAGRWVTLKHEIPIAGKPMFWAPLPSVYGVKGICMEMNEYQAHQLYGVADTLAIYLRKDGYTDTPIFNDAAQLRTFATELLAEAGADFQRQIED